MRTVPKDRMAIPPKKCGITIISLGESETSEYES
jgi:hypothetical protein